MSYINKELSLKFVIFGVNSEWNSTFTANGYVQILRKNDFYQMRCKFVLGTRFMFHNVNINKIHVNKQQIRVGFLKLKAEKST